MKIIGVCGSPKKKGSTTMFALQKALDVCRAEGFDVEVIALADYKFSCCSDCGFCYKHLDCCQKDDFTQKILPILNDNEVVAFIFASPVYFGGISSLLKTFLDRTIPFRRNGSMFQNKIAGAITVGRARNGGQELAAIDILKSCMVHGMTIVTDAAPTSHFGGILWSGNDDIENDEIGIKSAQNLGKRVAQIVKKLYL